MKIKSKTPQKTDLEARKCKSLLGYSNEFGSFFVYRETRLVCRKGKHSPKPIFLPQNCFTEAFKSAHNHHLSGNLGSEKTVLSLKRFF